MNFVEIEVFAHVNAPSTEHWRWGAKSSTELQLLECIEEWTYSISKNVPSLSIYFDFSKAFDCVSHNKLNHILNGFKPSVEIYNWISSFLSERSFMVIAENTFSSSFDVISGVPQGSVLGPFLFLLYINDIVKSIKHCKIKHQTFSVLSLHSLGKQPVLSSTHLA